jgi:hypothetical protein
MNSELLIDILGWVGVVALLLAYGLVSARRLAGDSAVYQTLNVLGSGLLIVNSYYYRAMPSVAVNVFWIGIGVFSLARVWLGKRADGGE